MICELGERVDPIFIKMLPAYAVAAFREIGGDFNDMGSFLMDRVRVARGGDFLSSTLVRIGHEDKVKDLLPSLLHYIFRLGQWASHGLNVFDVTTSLGAALLLTTPNDDPGFPLLPFPSFHVRLPKGLIPLHVTTQQGAVTRWCDKITVNQYLLRELEDEESRLMTNMVIGETEGRIPDLSYLIDNQSFVSPAHTCDELLHSLDTDDLSMTDEDAVSQKLGFLFVSNLCSWLETIGGLKDRKPDNAKSSSKRNDETGDRDRISQWIVGREVKLQPELLQSAKDQIMGLNPKRRSATWCLSRRHTVRGHYRWQACGHNMTERKRIWIAPHWHGPKGGDVAAHIYKLQSSDNV